MLEDALIVGIVMSITEILKRIMKQRLDEDFVTQLLPLVVLGLAGALNVGNAYVFDPSIPWTAALAEGLTLGAFAGGVYSMGKAALGKS